MDQNGSHIARHACLKVLEPSRPIMPHAYGVRKIRALVEKLHSKDNVVVSEALYNLTEELKILTNATQALQQTDIIVSLTKLVEKGNMRLFVVDCLAHLAHCDLGKRQIIAANTLDKILQIFVNVDIRKLKRGIFAVLEAVAHTGTGADAILQAGYVEALAFQLKQVSSNPVALCAAANVLSLLCKNTQKSCGITFCIEVGVVEKCIKLIGIHPQLAVREEVGALLNVITFTPHGRDRALEYEDVFPILCKVLRSIDPTSGVMGSSTLRAFTASILANICVFPQGKLEAHKSNTLAYLSSMIRKESHVDEILSGLRAISVLAELPQIRADCREGVTLDYVRELIQDGDMGESKSTFEDKESELVASIASSTLQQLLWKP